MMLAERYGSTQGRQIIQLEAQIANLTDALDNGLPRSSAALAERLAKAEAELGRARLPPLLI